MNKVANTNRVLSALLPLPSLCLCLSHTHTHTHTQSLQMCCLIKRQNVQIVQRTEPNTIFFILHFLQHAIFHCCEFDDDLFFFLFFFFHLFISNVSLYGRRRRRWEIHTVGNVDEFIRSCKKCCTIIWECWLLHTTYRLLYSWYVFALKTKWPRYCFCFCFFFPLLFSVFISFLLCVLFLFCTATLQLVFRSSWFTAFQWW